MVVLIGTEMTIAVLNNILTFTDYIKKEHRKEKELIEISETLSDLMYNHLMFDNFHVIMGESDFNNLVNILYISKEILKGKEVWWSGDNFKFIEFTIDYLKEQIYENT